MDFSLDFQEARPEKCSIFWMNLMFDFFADF